MDVKDIIHGFKVLRKSVIPETDSTAWFFEHEDWMKNVTSGDYQKYYDDMYSNR